MTNENRQYSWSTGHRPEKKLVLDPALQHDTMDVQPAAPMNPDQALSVTTQAFPPTPQQQATAPNVPTVSVQEQSRRLAVARSCPLVNYDPLWVQNFQLDEALIRQYPGRKLDMDQLWIKRVLKHNDIFELDAVYIGNGVHQDVKVNIMVSDVELEAMAMY